MPNTFAYLMLIVWPVVSLILFTRLRPLEATLWTILGGYMILPESTEFDFPLIPALNKESISTLVALAGCYFIAKQKVPLLPRDGTEKWLVIVMLICPLITTMTNQEPFRSIPGMTLYDAVSFIMLSYIGIIPFLLGLHLVKTQEDQLNVFRLIVIAGLIYSLPALFESRMSPQLHSTIYGFFPHEWRQQIRFGGFRPVIFMTHGLVVATFFATAFMSAIALWKEKQSIFRNSPDARRFTVAVVIYLLFILILCRSVGALLFGIAFLGIVAYMPLPTVRLATLFIIGVVVTYPLSSLLGIFPHAELVNLAGTISADRAQSLGFRFLNEDILLTHAREKLMFGWGLWGRNRPYSETVTDGYWIIYLGSVGLVGFLAMFGLPALGVFRSLRARLRLQVHEGKNLLVFHGLLVAIIMVDQILNSSLSPYIWFLIGGLVGRANFVLHGRTQLQKSRIGRYSLRHADSSA